MRKLNLKINAKDYVLEMNRTSIKWLEAFGFSIEEFNKKPITYYDLLWTSLFIANHKEVNPNSAMKLLESYEKEKGAKMVTKVIKFAIEEYDAFIDALADTNSTQIDEELEIIEA